MVVLPPPPTLPTGAKSPLGPSWEVSVEVAEYPFEAMADASGIALASGPDLTFFDSRTGRTIWRKKDAIEREAIQLIATSFGLVRLAVSKPATGSSETLVQLFDSKTGRERLAERVEHRPDRRPFFTQKAIVFLTSPSADAQEARLWCMRGSPPKLVEVTHWLRAYTESPLDSDAELRGIRQRMAASPVSFGTHVYAFWPDENQPFWLSLGTQDLGRPDDVWPLGAGRVLARYEGKDRDTDTIQEGLPKWTRAVAGWDVSSPIHPSLRWTFQSMVGQGGGASTIQDLLRVGHSNWASAAGGLIAIDGEGQIGRRIPKAVMLLPAKSGLYAIVEEGLPRQRHYVLVKVGSKAPSQLLQTGDQRPQKFIPVWAASMSSVGKSAAVCRLSSLNSCFPKRAWPEARPSRRALHRPPRRLRRSELP
ncbi:hypothetical protein EON79_15290 [bacterium]|nr:MAG: hypothetical protein EON79_15290 [bacterium]